MDKFVNSYKKERGEEPGIEEITDELDVEEEKVRNARRARQGSVSLDKPLKEGEVGGETLEDIIAEEDAPRPKLEAFGDMLEDRLMGLFDQVLSDRERQTLKLHYGLEESVPDS
ncbi:MAG: sigma-70 domain-containing protein [Candidatus Acetothermia bacterium]